MLVSCSIVVVLVWLVCSVWIDWFSLNSVWWWCLLCIRFCI